MKKKIAFFICKKDLYSWNGGINYFKYFLSFLTSIKKYEFIIFTDDISFIKKNFPSFLKKTKYSSILDQYSILFFIRTLISFVFRKDYLIYFLLRINKINILSHRSLFKNKNIKIIGWIQDAQHLKFKNFFLEKNLVYRTKYINKEIINSDYVFVGSKTVKNELKKKCKNYQNFLALKIFIKPKNYNYTPKKQLFYYPAQFWKHKNHLFLLKVFNKIVKKKPNIKLILSGSKVDHRFPEYHKKIQNFIKNKQLQKNILIKDNLSFKKTKILKKKCTAFIVPSLYEGWNLVVEEARSLNKIVLLSNIPSHIEQNYSKSIFFALNDEKDLYKKIINFNINKKFSKHNRDSYETLKKEAIKLIIFAYENK